MRLDEAYQQWGQQSENRELYKKTKEVFRKATWLLPTNQQCSYYTLEMIARAFAQTSMAVSDRTKAASVICHVLNYAHTVDPDNNPKPNFGYEEITHFRGKDMVVLEESPAAPVRGQVPDMPEGHMPEGQVPDSKSVGEQSPGTERPLVMVKPAAKAKRMAELAKRDGGKAAKKAEKAVVQLDKDTLKPIKVWKSCHAPQTELGIRNVQRAVARRGLAGGYYWCRPADVETFKPNSVRGQVPDRKIAPTTAAPARGQSPDRISPDRTDKPKPSYLKTRDDRYHLNTEQPTEAPTLADVTDEQLLAEIRRRGWKGQVTITKTIEL